MSKVIKVGPGVVSVGPPEVTALDILEYAYEAIKEYGWRNTKKDGPAPEGSGSPTPEQAKKHGLSIHDAIGLACVQLSKAYGEEVGKETPTGTKDWNYASRTATGETRVENLRALATGALGLGGPDSRQDWQFNDNQDDPQPVYDLFETAIAALS